MANENTCPGCGLVVPAGYPRCPRCHAAMPAVLPPASPRGGGARDPGGTALPDSRRPILLIVAVVVALAAAVTAVVILMRDGSGGDRRDDKTGQPAPGTRPTAAPSGGAEEPAGPEQPDEPPAPGATPSATALTSELQSRRLWATVELEGTTAVVNSAYCNDPGMNESLAAATADLVASGVTGVRCHERHGPLVFERGLGR